MTLAAAACGFHLRGTADLPFSSVYVPGANAGIALDLARNLRAGTNVKLVDNAKQAEAILEFTGETRAKEILSLTGAGRVSEFRLRYRVGFRAPDGSVIAHVDRRADSTAAEHSQVPGSTPWPH